MKPEPIADNVDFLVKVHVLMHQQLRNLVDDDDNKRDDEILIDLH
jgi:hypothetical protein